VRFCGYESDISPFFCSIKLVLCCCGAYENAGKRRTKLILCCCGAYENAGKRRINRSPVLVENVEIFIVKPLLYPVFGLV
jgi:hypothetical protein